MHGPAMGDLQLSDLEQELVELCSVAPHMGETTTLDEEMLQASPGRETVEATLRGLVARGLMTTSRAVFGGDQRNRDGSTEHRVYEDDWWVVTAAGRREIGLPQTPSQPEWINPSNGQFRRSPVNAAAYRAWLRLRRQVGH
jgi:hypothetical protein